MAGMDMIRASPRTRTGRLTLKPAALRKYPGLSALFFRALAAYASNLLPDVGQNILSPAIRMSDGISVRLTRRAIRMSDGISVRLTRRAIRTPKPRPMPIDRRSVKLVNVIAPKAIMTVVALVAMLSPDQVMDVWTACALS